MNLLPVNKLQNPFLVGFLALFMLLSVPAYTKVEGVKSLDELLKTVEQGRYREARENREREQRFMQNKAERETMLSDLKAEQERQENLSTKLEKQFDENDQAIIEAEQRLKERLGSLDELFGHITSAAGDLRGNVETSLVSVNYPDREVFLEELIEITSSGTDLPSIDQISELLLSMQREMTEQGRVVRFKAPVNTLDGDTVEKTVVRVGVFNAFTDEGKYLQMSQGGLSELARQPSASVVNAAAELASTNEGIGKVGIDPTGPSGGSYLSALISSPTLVERWHQGGYVGYFITALGIFAMILALYRIGRLTVVNSKVSKQLQSTNPSDDNPLGRVISAASKNTGADLETMELKLNEAVLKELPRLQAGESVLKIISAVAPLLGLLGTVTGMILTFQAITIHGAGDPQAMAGGISSALVTTVLGLVVAIPTVLMHTWVSTRSKRVIHILEEQAAGIVALHQEKLAGHD